MEDKISRRLLLGGSLALLADQIHLPSIAEESIVPHDLDHEHFMSLAIAAGKKYPAAPFGAVVVNMKTRQVVSEGWVRVNKNPIWHGEMTAINNCPDADTGFNWKEVCLYTTGESCPMCQAAIIYTGMPLVVYGSSRPFLQKYKYGDFNTRAKTIIDSSINGKCQIIGGVLEKECNQLFEDAKRKT